jgi:MYXO-CTERM domain-containing protein
MVTTPRFVAALVISPHQAFTRNWLDPSILKLPVNFPETFAQHKWTNGIGGQRWNKWLPPGAWRKRNYALDWSVPYDAGGEPASASLLALGALGFVRRRRY